MTRGSMPSLAGKGNHDAKYAGLNQGSARMLTPLVSRKKPACPRNVIRMATEDTGGRRRRSLCAPSHTMGAHPPTPAPRRVMAGEISFDVVSDFDEQELRNALDQVRREVIQRYDLKNSHVDLTQEKTQLVLVTDDEFHAGVVKDLIESKAVRRNLS